MTNQDILEANEVMDLPDEFKALAEAAAMEPCAECAAKDAEIAALRKDIDRLKRYGGPTLPEGGIDGMREELEKMTTENAALRNKLTNHDQISQTLAGCLAVTRHLGRMSNLGHF